MAKKALLMILDGWGIGKQGKGDVIYNTPTPYLDYLTAVSAHSQLQASGEDVGLPDGQMGNSEVGHLNIGAGRIVYQDLVKINRACKDGSIMENPQVKAAYTYAKENNKKLHLMGLCSDGGVHSSLDHLFKLIEIGKAYGLNNQLFVHCYMDGRDTDPRSGKGFIEQVTKVCADNGAAIASIIGRCADATLFIIRAEMLDRSLLPDIQQYYDENRLPKMSVILNGTTDSFSYYGSHRYGARYGYYGGSGSYGGYTKDDD